MKKIWGIIYIVFGMAMLLLMIFVATDAISIVVSQIHYMGDIIISTQNEEKELVNLINSNADFGPLNIWKPGYDISEVDSGEKIFHYAFFSKNENLNFCKSK